MMDTWEMVDGERASFADLTDSLSPGQWDQPSLCTAWRVRDVIAHVTEGSHVTAGKALVVLAKHGFRIDAMLRGEAIKGGANPTETLRKGLRDTIGNRRMPPGAKPVDLLLDLVVHQQDIRRPLGLVRTVPAQALAAALDHACSRSGPGSSLLPGKKRTRDLKLRATDIGWERGEGAEVSGPGEALLMAVGGRTAALGELTGSGIDALRAHTGG
jgi:uncharacterized protein (TIGR03083 family)